MGCSNEGCWQIVTICWFIGIRNSVQCDSTIRHVFAMQFHCICKVCSTVWCAVKITACQNICLPSTSLLPKVMRQEQTNSIHMKVY